MLSGSKSFPLEQGLDLNNLTTTGSVLHINEDYDDDCDQLPPDQITQNSKDLDFLGKPITNFNEVAPKLVSIDERGYVKKKIIEKGGGMPLNERCTVYIAYSGFWENEQEPFDTQNLYKPLEVNLSDNGLLPGLQIAVKSMLVGEVALFLLSYTVMYGELGIPPRIKPKSDCVFYIKLVKSILTPKEGRIDFKESNMFQRVIQEARQLFSAGLMFFKSNNFIAAIQVFKKAVNMLHRCRLADELEEKVQEKLLIKFYINLAVCYNKTKNPLKACTACNELNRLNHLWNNSKALYQNAIALRMIGDFERAEKRLRRAFELSPDVEELNKEFKLLKEATEKCNKSKLTKELNQRQLGILSEEFKKEVDNLIKNFKESDNLCKLVMPANLKASEIEYIREACIRENLFFNRIQKSYALDKEKEIDKDVASENEHESHKISENGQ